MSNLLKPEEILQDELDPQILLKVERLRGPTAWDYDSVIRSSIQHNQQHRQPRNVYPEVFRKLDKYSDKSISPVAMSSYPEIIHRNYTTDDWLCRYTGDYIIGIKAIRPVKFTLQMGLLYIKVNLKAEEYKNDIFSGYPIPQILMCLSTYRFKFSQGFLNDIEILYSYAHPVFRQYISDAGKKILVIPYDNPDDSDNKYNIIINLTVGVFNQVDTDDLLLRSYKSKINSEN